MQFTVPPKNSKASSLPKDTCTFSIMVPEPTPPNVRPLISDPGSAAIPANSIRTNLKIPLSSFASVPPYLRPTPPSTVGAGSNGRLVGALPKITIPPQSPGVLCPIGLPLVNTIGSVALPSAINFAPLSIIMAPFSVMSLTITEPGAIVIVLPSVTYTYPFKVYLPFGK